MLYRGDIAHKGVIYPGEQEALVSRELWQEVNDKHRLSRTQTTRHRRVDAPLTGRLHCGQCGGLLTPSVTRRHGQGYLYYVCRNRACPQKPLSASDLESALRERNLDYDYAIGSLVRSVSYHSGTRRITVEWADTKRWDFFLPVPVRPGVRRKEEQIGMQGRTARISRLMALAIHLEGLVRKGAVRNAQELAEAGHVSRARLSQILQLTQLAPEIQEQLLFLPPTRRGSDRLLEKHLRPITHLLDWQEQKQRFVVLQQQLGL